VLGNQRLQTSGVFLVDLRHRLKQIVRAGMSRCFCNRRKTRPLILVGHCQ